MQAPEGPRDFATTHWSLVAAASTNEPDRSGARRALEELCRTYWYPLYAFVRRSGHRPEDAQDLTQAFFTRIIETGGFPGADPERGRFRSYLLGALKHFLANEWRRSQTLKRGGAHRILEWNALDPEARFADESTPAEQPEILYDRAWALETVATALGSLRKEMAYAGKSEQFKALQSCLTGDGEPPRAQTAETLGMSTGAVKVAVHRLRQRYRELLRATIAETVGTEDDLEDEMRHLVAVLRSR